LSTHPPPILHHPIRWSIGGQRVEEGWTMGGGSLLYGACFEEYYRDFRTIREGRPRGFKKVFGKWGQARAGNRQLFGISEQFNKKVNKILPSASYSHYKPFNLIFSKIRLLCLNNKGINIIELSS